MYFLLASLPFGCDRRESDGPESSGNWRPDAGDTDDTDDSGADAGCLADATVEVTNATDGPLRWLWICDTKDCTYLLDGVALQPGQVWQKTACSGETILAVVDDNDRCADSVWFDLTAGDTYEWTVDELWGTVQDGWCER